jgi:hypothetical protein
MFKNNNEISLLNPALVRLCINSANFSRINGSIITSRPSQIAKRWWSDLRVSYLEISTENQISLDRDIEIISPTKRLRIKVIDLLIEKFLIFAQDVEPAGKQNR